LEHEVRIVLFSDLSDELHGFPVLQEPVVLYARTHRDAEEPQVGQLCSSITLLATDFFELNSESEANSLSA
jgi:hypothetical protein